MLEGMKKMECWRDTAPAPVEVEQKEKSVSQRLKKGEMVSVMTSTASCKGQAIWEMGFGMGKNKTKETNAQTQEVKGKAIPGN